MGGSTVAVIITGDAAGASKALDQVTDKIGQLQSAQKKSEGSSKGADSALKGLNSTLGALGFTASIAGALALAGALDEVGSSSLEAKGTLDALSGGDTAGFIDAVTSSTDGMISRLDAAKISNKALTAGFFENEQQLKNISAAAAVFADVMGVDTVDAENTLVDAVNRGNTRLLAQLGIVQKGADTTAAINKIMAQQPGITETQAAQLAAYNAVMEKYSELAAQGVGQNRSLADSQERLAAAAENAKTALGEELAQEAGPAKEAVTGILTSFTQWLDSSKAVQEQQHQLQLQAAASADTYEEYAAAAQKLGIANYGGFKTFQDLKKEIQDTTSATKDATEATSKHEDAVRNRTDALALATEKQKKYSDDMNIQAGQQLAILPNIDSITGAQAGLNTIYDFGAGALKNYNLSAADQLRLTQELGLATGELTQLQINQTSTINELNNLWAAGIISTGQYKDAMKQIQDGSDPLKVSLETQQGAINSLARTYMDQGMPAAQAMAKAQKDVASEAAGTTLTLDQAKKKISELSEVVAKAAKIKPADISINSNAPTVNTDIQSVITSHGLMADMPPAEIFAKDATVTAAGVHVQTVTDNLAALDGNEATIFVNIVTTGEIPSVPGGTATSGGPSGKAGGGPVKKGVPYFTGEEGTELFIPETNGIILPHNATQQLLNQSGASAQGGGLAGAPIYNFYGPITVLQAPGASWHDLMQEAAST